MLSDKFLAGFVDITTRRSPELAPVAYYIDLNTAIRHSG